MISLARGAAVVSEPQVAPFDDATRAHRIALLFDTHYDAIWRTLRRLGVPDASADDAAQRVFVVATRRLETIIEGEEGRFLYGVAVRIASEIRRRDPARRELPDSDALLASIADDAPGPEETLLDHEAMSALDAVLADMPDDLREVLVLAEIEGLSAPEVATMLEIPIGTVASRLRRAREAFTTSARRIRARLGLAGGTR
jgi:RNA polymerase sigma-70 factor (ECF subfamily)